MPLRPDMDLREYLEVLGRRKWIIALFLITILFCAFVYLVITPPQYRSTTSILVIPQEAPANYVRPTVTVGIEGQLGTIRQQVASRTRLMKVIEGVGLFEKMREERSEEDVIEAMRKRVEIDVVVPEQRSYGRMGRGESEAFSLSFSYEDPKLAMQAVSRLASLFIEEKLKSRERQAVQTSGLLESQMRETKANLMAQERKIAQYKMRHAGELPEELQSNLANLARLQNEFQVNTVSIQSIEQRKVSLHQQLGQIEKESQPLVHAGGKLEVDTSQAETQALISELNSRRSQLAELSIKYTERHPDVMRLRREVVQLEKKLEEAPKTLGVEPTRETNNPGTRTYIPVTGMASEEYRRLKSQIRETEKEIEAAKAERASIREKIDALQAKVAKVPSREQEMISLTRDYENLKNLYNDLQKKRMEANIAEDLENRQKEEQFQILDPANLPEKPFKPDKKKVLVLALLIGSMMGLGGAIVLEMTDQTIRGVKDFQQLSNIRVLASIPDVDLGAGSRRNTFLLGAVLAGGLLFLAVTLLYWFYAEEIRILLKI